MIPTVPIFRIFDRKLRFDLLVFGFDYSIFFQILVIYICNCFLDFYKFREVLCFRFVVFEVSIDLYVSVDLILMNLWMNEWFTFNFRLLRCILILCGMLINSFSSSILFALFIGLGSISHTHNSVFSGFLLSLFGSIPLYLLEWLLLSNLSNSSKSISLSCSLLIKGVWGASFWIWLMPKFGYFFKQNEILPCSL